MTIFYVINSTNQSKIKIFISNFFYSSSQRIYIMPAEISLTNLFETSTKLFTISDHCPILAAHHAPTGTHNDSESASTSDSLSPSPAPPSTLALGPLLLQWRALFKMMYGKNFDKCTKMSHEFVVQTKRDCCCSRFCCCCCLFCLVSLFAVDFFMYSQASSSLQLLLLFFLLSVAQTSSESGDETICFAAYTCFPCTSTAKSRGKREAEDLFE